MGRISTNFLIEEFVPPELFNTFGDYSKWFIRPEIIKLAEFYRRWFDKPLYVNTWKFGGLLKERGWRFPETKTGGRISQHKFGCAFDCHISGLSADEVRKEIFNHEKEFMEAGLTTVEHGAYSPTWIHSDIRFTGMSNLLIVKPSVTTHVMVVHDDQYYTLDESDTQIYNIMGFEANTPQ